MSFASDLTFQAFCRLGQGAVLPGVSNNGFNTGLYNPLEEVTTP